MVPTNPWEMAGVLVQTGGEYTTEGMWWSPTGRGPGRGRTGPGAEATLGTVVLTQNTGEQVWETHVCQVCF